MIRIMAVSDVEADTLSVLDQPLPDLAAQPLVLRDRAACTDWLDAQATRFPAEQPRECMSCIATPAGIERVFDDNGSAVTQRIMTSPDEASALVEWQSPHGAELDVRWTYEGANEIAFLFSTPVEATSVQSGGSADTIAHIAIPAGGAVRLVMMRDIAQIAQLDPARWLKTHAARTERRRMEHLRLETGDALFDATWEWWTYLATTGSDSATKQIGECARNVLGIEPDAERGRLVMRPRLPQEWPKLTVHNIRVDDALIRLEYESSESSRVFTLVQTAGAYPIRLIFEPLLPREPRHAFVDGTPASLNLRPDRNGVIAPVQIMLDEKRVVGFEV